MQTVRLQPRRASSCAPQRAIASLRSLHPTWFDPSTQAILNFDLSEYQDILENPDAYDPAAAAAAATARAAGSSSAGAPAAARAARCPSVDMAAAAVAAAMGAQILAAAGGPLGLLPGAGMLLPLVAGTAPQMWGFALPPGTELAPPCQPGFPGAAAYQHSPVGLSHPCGPALGSHQGLTSQGGYQPSPASTASHHPCLPATSSSEFGPLGMLNTANGAAAEPGSPLLRLPAIRTRVAATAAGGGNAAAAVGGDVATAGTPLTTRSADVDLAGFLLSPLGAALLSPLVLAGTPGSGETLAYDSLADRPFAEHGFCPTDDSAAIKDASSILEGLGSTSMHPCYASLPALCPHPAGWRDSPLSRIFAGGWGAGQQA